MANTTAKISKATLDDFVGYDYIKNDIKDIIDILSDTKRYREFGVDIPKGLILSGAPGLGKTLLTRIISGETGLPTFNISASEEKTSANKVCKQISNIFKKAQKHAPSIVIMDELDRMIPNDDFTSDKSRSILSTLLTNLDGVCGDHSGVFVIATTNGWDDIDDALKRSGRLDRRITICAPNTESRSAILKYYLDKANHISYNDDLLDQLAVKTLSFSCADLKKLVNDALLMCMRLNSKEFKLTHFIDAIMKIRLNDLPRSLTEIEKSSTAYHELGHCIVSYKLKGILPDIIIRKFDSNNGANLFDADSTDDVPDDITRNNFAATAQILLAGMAAEDVFVHDISIGARGDMDRVRTIWCLSYGFGVYGLDSVCVTAPQYIQNEYGGKPTAYPEAYMPQYQSDFVDFIKKAYDDAKQILIENENLIRYLHKILVAKEFLPKEDIAILIEGYEETEKLKNA